MSDVTTRLIIQGNKDDIHDFVGRVKGITNLDFECILPIPFEIKYTSFPIKIVSEENYQIVWHKWMSKRNLSLLTAKEKYIPNLPITFKIYDYLMNKYGYSNWCEWSIDHYGTKTIPYEVGDWNRKNNYATITYTTCWSPASQFYLTVSKLYPHLIFKHEYYDDQEIYIGNETIVFGHIVDSEDFSYNSIDAILLKASLM